MRKAAVYSKTGNITVHNINLFTSKMTRLNKRCAKLEVPPVTFKFGETKEFTFEFEKRPKVTVDMIEVTVSWEADIVIGGWRLAAAVEADRDAVLVYPVPGVENIGRIEKVTCDHCRTNRARKYGYILENEEGNRIMVGKQCLKDYLGHDPASIIFQSGVSFADLFFDEKFADMDEEEFASRMGKGEFRIDLCEYLTAVCYTVEQVGAFFSKKQASEDFSGATISTASAALHIMESPRAMEKFYKDVKGRHWEKAKKIIECVKSSLTGRNDLNDYQLHLELLANMGDFKVKSAGFAASMYSFYHRELEKQEKERRIAEEAESNPSEYLGEVKKRMDFGPVTLIKEHTFDGYYGPTGILTFKDAAGNAIKWFKSGGGWYLQDKEKMLEVGDIIELTATVKKHEVDKYSKEKTTLIQRGAITQPKKKRTRKK